MNLPTKRSVLLTAELKHNTLIVSPLTQKNVIKCQLTSSPKVTRKFLKTKEEKLKFVQEYIQYKPFLVIGRKHENKSRKMLRHIALDELSKKMNIPGFGPKEAYAKLRNIKSTYCQELKRIKNEAARGKKYVSNLVWFETLDNAYRALRKEEGMNEKPESSAEMDEETSQSEDNEDQSNNLQIFKEEEYSNHLENEEEFDIEIPETNVDSKDTLTVVTSPITDNNETTSNTNMRNEFDIFGDSIAAQLKNMPLTDALEAQMFIQNYLSNLRMQALRSQMK